MLMAVMTIMAVIAASVGLLDLNPLAAQAEPNASRSFSPDPVDAGSEVTVTITAEGHGAFGDVVETLPAGFTYLSSSLPDDQVTSAGQTVTLSLLGGTSPTTFTYTVTASSVEGDHSFTGVFSGVDAGFESFSGVQVGGDPSLTVRPAPAVGPSASRSFSPDPVDAGGQVTVRITADGYGSFGDVAETLPAGFTYSFSSLPDDQVTRVGQTVTFALIGGTPPTTFTYTVATSSVEGAHSFTGVFSGVDADFESFSGVQVGGDPSLTVRPAPAVGPSASRSFSPDPVDAGGQVTVRITADGYGSFGDVAETLPAGFTYSFSSLPDDQVTRVGQTVTFALIGGTPPTTFTYTVAASSVEGAHSFTGVFSGVDADFESFSGVQVGGDSSLTVRVVAPEPEPQVNRAPVFSAGNSTTRSIDENSASGANVGAVVRATDADRDTLTYTLTGTDAGSFTINSGTGQIMVRAGTTLDYETKASYMVTVTATDPAGDSDSIAVTITVTDVVELGMVSSDATAEYAENGMGSVATYAADGPVTAGWSVSGADMDDFDISNEGVLSFRRSPNFENPTDADMDNTYMVTVKAEAGGEMEMVEVTVMVTNVDEIGTLSGPETVSNYMENSEDLVGTYMVSGGSMSEMDNLTLEGDDAGDFSISSAGVLSFRSSPDFENPTDADMDNTYMVTVKAEAGGEMAMQPVTVTVTNVDEDGTVMLSSMAPVVGVELTATLADPDMVTEDTVTWQWSKSTTMDGTFEDIDGATMMTYTPVAADENYYLMAKAMYTDGHGSEKMAMATSANAVSTGDPLLATYDTNPENGMIDRPEVISAINDYLDNGVPSRADVIRLINLYLDS